jgi:hypothetical protein
MVVAKRRMIHGNTNKEKSKRTQTSLNIKKPIENASKLKWNHIIFPFRGNSI